MKSVEVKKWVSKWGIEISLAVLLFALVAVAGSLMPNFLKVNSQLLLSRHVWEMGILALGMTLIVISGGIDLSVGSTMALAAVGFGIVFGATGLIWMSALAAILIGLSCGALNGWLIARFKVHPLIITAVVVGGASIAGGKGRILGTVLGVLLIHETRLFADRVPPGTN